MAATARVGVIPIEHLCVIGDPVSHSLQGFCFDIWMQASYDLNITNSWVFAKNYPDLMNLFKNNKIDVAIERIDIGAPMYYNVTK